MNTDENNDVSDTDESTGQPSGEGFTWETADDRAVKRGRAVATAAALNNGRDPPEIDDETAAELGELSANVDAATQNSRYEMQQRYGGSGTSHNGQRDIDGVLGYPSVGEVSAADYYERYREQDVAKAIVDAPVHTTWRNTPMVEDDESTGAANPGRESAEIAADDEEMTEFEEAVETLLSTEHIQRGLGYYWERSDRNCRLGNYSLLVFGFDDGQPADEPVNTGALNGPDALRFVTPVRQEKVVNWELAGPDDERDPGLPLYYDIQIERPTANGGFSHEKRRVHYSRVLHITDDPDATRLLSTPALEPLLHRLIDFEKVMGASAEMFWTGADRKFFFSNQTGGGGPQPGGGGGAGGKDPNYTALDDHLRMMMHGMKPALYADDMDMETIDGQTPDPTGIIDVLYQSFAAVSGIPKRILTGSERGELASSQDAANWFGRISERQEQFAEPVLVRGTLDMLIEYGVLPEPSGGDYDVIWPSLFEQDAQDEANTRSSNARAVKDIENAAAASSVPREFLYEEVLGIEIPDDLIEEPDEAELAVPEQFLPPTAGGSEPPEAGAGAGDGESPDAPEAPSPESAGDGTDGGGAVEANTNVDVDADAVDAVREQFESMTDTSAATDGGTDES